MAPVLKADVVNSYRGFESHLVLMKNNSKSKLFGTILSDGSFRFISINKAQGSLPIKRVDLINHSVWTGRRPKKQTEISAFIGRFGGVDKK